MAANRQTNRHTHARAQAVTLVWASLRLAPIMIRIYFKEVCLTHDYIISQIPTYYSTTESAYLQIMLAYFVNGYLIVAAVVMSAVFRVKNV